MNTSKVKHQGNQGDTGNITLRRVSKYQNSKMATTSPVITRDLEIADGSLFMDSILSQKELEEVEKMIALKGEMHERNGMNLCARQLDFLTSTQTTRNETGRASSLIMSPILDPDFENPFCGRINISNRFAILAGEVEELNYTNEHNKIRSHDENPISYCMEGTS